MSEQHPLHKDVFRAIIAVGWIDGVLTEDEAEAILRAARDEGLEDYALEGLRVSTRAQMDFGEIDESALSREDRLYVYAVASWVTLVDGRIDPIERDALHAIATVVGVTGRGRVEMDQVVAELSARQHPPSRMDLRGLRDAISAKIRSFSATA